MSKYLLPVLAALCLIALGGFTINKTVNSAIDKADLAGYARCKSENATAVVQKVENNEKIKQDVIRLDDAALVRRYCHWVYDTPYDECVRTVKPIP